jgi:hypothetical protein
MPNNAPHNALRAVVAGAMANGAPAYVNKPVDLKMPIEELDSFLGHAVTRWDRMQAAKAARSKRGYYNPNALAIYLGRVEETVDAVRRGLGVEAALQAGFNDRLLAFLLNAVTTGKLPAVKD